ncbi:MAG: MBL fold metallo-hydrolase [Proteobacteria bacterium]|nr:MAG: MBL fold metallo-hydrolase [Pseudomonadota bacterium]
MKVKLWGVRGSLPSPQRPDQVETRLTELLERFDNERHTHAHAKAFMETLPLSVRYGFGGNTACVEVHEGPDRLIIDAGSGLRVLGEKLMREGGSSEVHLFFTHFHWDHLIGLPFFPPVFIKGKTVHLYAVQPDLEECVRALFKKPFFPVPFEELGGKLIFHRLEPRKKIRVQNFDVTPYELDHPDPCWGYRIERDGKTYAHCVDTEATRVSREDMGLDAALYENADLVLFDAQYTMMEAAEKMNWGHSAAPIGLEIALREHVKKILFAHHDPGASDEKIDDAERQTRDYLDAYTEQQRRSGKNTPTVEWSFAREGEELTL